MLGEGLMRFEVREQIKVEKAKYAGGDFTCVFQLLSCGGAHIWTTLCDIDESSELHVRSPPGEPGGVCSRPFVSFLREMSDDTTQCNRLKLKQEQQDL